MAIIGQTPTPVKKKLSLNINPATVLRILQVVFLLTVCGLGYGIYETVLSYNELAGQTDTLRYTTIYNEAKDSLRASVNNPSNSDQKTQFLKEILQKQSLQEIVTMNSNTDKELNQTKGYFESIQYPYQYFLQYYLLPPINLWKDKFTNKIDDTIIGQKFLQNNPFLDVNLISQRTDFFKNIGRDSAKNEIKDISVSDVVENIDGTFILTVSLSFVSETKRSFLLLVDKLSATSNRENLGLLNEFFFTVWTVLKEKSMWTALGSWATAPTSWDLQNAVWMSDEMIWQEFYKWVEDPKSTFIVEEDIIHAIRRMANCESEGMPTCYFKFREKTRSIPMLAYSVWMPNTNKVDELKMFIRTMPPLINIKWFTFKRKTTVTNQEATKSYEGNITIDAYGTSISSNDINEISSFLGGVCTNDQPLTPEVAIAQLEKTIKQSTQVTQISNEKSKQLNDLRKSLLDAQKQYNSAIGFKRAIKLFEIYRMLFDNRLCTRK